MGIVQPPLMTAQPRKSPPYPKNCLLSRPLVAQMKLNAQLGVAQKPTGSAVPTTDIVQPPLMNAQLDVAQKPTGSVVPTTDIVPPPLMTAQQKKLPTIPRKLNVIKTTCGPDETECPAGCCPEANWFCCPDNRYCAATADDCPAKKFPTLPKKLSVVKTTCGPDETECPAGCCPEANWFCCPDNRYCAATADDCP